MTYACGSECLGLGNDGVFGPLLMFAETTGYRGSQAELSGMTWGGSAEEKEARRPGEEVQAVRGRPRLQRRGS